MSSFPGCRSVEEIASSILLVEAEWGTTTQTATAFVIAKLRDTGKLILATAKHVVNVPDDEVVSWKFRQLADDGHVVRQASFGTSRAAKGDVPYRTHNSLDVAIFVAPTLGSDHRPFARDDERPVRTIDIVSGVSTGTRVAWAGFPSIVESALGFPTLCYFEGVVSAMVNRQDRQVYVVDGHGAQGVSGGPVWHWSEERDRLEVVGIVSNYCQPDGGLPGFCMFEPINPVLDFLASEVWHPDKVGDHVIVNRDG